MKLFATIVIGVGIVAAQQCDTPGKYICGQALEAVYVCSPTHRWILSANCGGNGCCTYSGASVYCIC